jgi:tRNA1Val (adenine37-N6)-methyltransferase
LPDGLSAGIVRPARRPRGWRAPGPPPGGPTGEARPGPYAGEDLCYLAGDWRILQRLNDHRWSLDDLVTAWFAMQQVGAAAPATLLDLGCGIGTVLMLLAWCFPAAHCVGVEAEAVSVDLARRSLTWNGIADRCAVVHGDLREPEVLSAGAAFDLVTGTPPYLPPGTATPSRRVQRGPAHLEYRGGIEVYCLAAARWLGDGGRFVACAAASRAPRVAAAAGAAGLAIARRRDVIPRAGKPALFSVYAMSRGTRSAVVVEPPLVVRDAAGRRTMAFHTLREEMGMPP